MSSRAANTKDEEQTEEETLSLHPEDSTKSQDTLLGKLYILNIGKLLVCSCGSLYTLHILCTRLG